MTLDTLEVSVSERQQFERLVPYVASSPRKVLWLANVYRLIKANDEYAGELLADEEASQALISQLVLVSMDPIEFEIWRNHLRQADRQMSVDTILWGLEHGWDKKDHQDCSDTYTITRKRDGFLEVAELGLTKLSTHRRSTISQPILLKYANLAKRYSFASAS